MNAPRYALAGLLVEHEKHRVMLDGGPGAVPREKLDAWLVTDEHSELVRDGGGRQGSHRDNWQRQQQRWGESVSSVEDFFACVGHRAIVQSMP